MTELVPPPQSSSSLSLSSSSFVVGTVESDSTVIGSKKRKTKAEVGSTQIVDAGQEEKYD